MILRSWRIVKTKHAASAMTGLGARLFGGRWNYTGTSVFYTASSISLGVLEMLVHLQSKDVLKYYATFELSFDSSLVLEVATETLPRNWWRPRPPLATREIGDTWVARQDSVILRLPSAIVRSEWNYLINPTHPSFRKIEIGPPRPIRLDRRLA